MRKTGILKLGFSANPLPIVQIGRFVEVGGLGLAWIGGIATDEPMGDGIEIEDRGGANTGDGGWPGPKEGVSPLAGLSSRKKVGVVVRKK